MVPVIVVLLIAGCILVLSSVIFDSAFSRQPASVWTEDDIERLVERRFNEAKYRLDNEAEKSAGQIKDQTERELEKLSNEKIMAVNEFSDQVMDQINKNHNEVMFLYSMLSDKQKELDATVGKLNRAKRQTEAEEKLSRAETRPEHIKEKQPQEKVKAPDTAKKQTDIEKKRMGQAKDLKQVPPKTRQDEKYENKQKIVQMFEEGVPSAEIAKQLHLGIGEVRLVLELSRGRKNQS
ncbi:MAG: hypothetical protein HFI75_10415 [Lachnospiraceae bacterium]|nr:hypothetical protein [Lachnospiraceae bacterium]